MVRLPDRPVMTLDVDRGRKTTTQQQQERLVKTRKYPKTWSRGVMQNSGSLMEAARLFMRLCIVYRQ